MTLLDSSSGFANDPLVNLLRLRKDKPVMSDEERRAAVMELRTLRTSPQALGKQLRKAAAESEDEESSNPNETGLSLDGTRSGKPRSASKSAKAAKDELKDLYGSLGL